MKTSSVIRQDFLDFFNSKEHRIVSSSPVIPYDDPSLLFTNAGMNQFKDVFLGTGKRDYTRCTNSQKCIRVSGKHNDLEEVGHDGYHHTFFEMLGNWSFGDYYKKEAIRWAWELLTEVWKLDKKKLWATVYRKDDETFKLWKTETDIYHSHILKFDENDNFWEMGETGPCGPCSEIHYDFTSNGCKEEDINSGNQDVMEIWNLVFIQYNRDSEGELHDLPQKHVDTGMGFERMVRVLQNKKSNYETDVFLPLINELIHITGKEYCGKFEAPMNVIADHVRTLTFAIGDGAIPSNEGRGYVLRRVLRRAARYGRELEMHKPFIYNLVDVLVNTMGNIFPEIIEKKKFICDVIQSEEESFNETLDRGIKLFNEEIVRMKQNNVNVFSGEAAFRLHDTYGFPIDLTELMARELGYITAVDEYTDFMSIQMERSRNTREITTNEDVWIKNKLALPFKINYDPYKASDNHVFSKYYIPKDLDNVVVLENNPFYFESGGQVSDSGELIMETGDVLKIIDSKKDYVLVENASDILSESIKNTFEISGIGKVKIDYPRRLSIQRNHSATHLVHEALRRVLGSHIKQMGSYLDDKLLRFDFPHFHKLKDDELKAIEEIVNGKVSENIQVITDKDITIEEAKKKYPNVRMFFGEKYADKVRVVVIDEKFSVELCGGTHVKETSDIGLFKIVKEESISSGTRRIFAVTGEGILDYIQERVRQIEKIINDIPKSKLRLFSDLDNRMLNFAPQMFSKNTDFKNQRQMRLLLHLQDATMQTLYDLRDEYLEEKKESEKILAKQNINMALEKIDSIVTNATVVDGMKIVVSEFDVDTMDELKSIADVLRNKIGSGAGLIYFSADNKINLCAVVSDNLIKDKKLNAGKIVGEVAKLIGGGGGGKPHLATAGGKDVSKLNDAISEFSEIIKRHLSI